MEKRAVQAYYLLLTCCLVLPACESTLDLPYTVAPKLTIISHLNPESTTGQHVYVYASQSASDPSKFYTPDNLVVDISGGENGVTLRLDTVIENGKIAYDIPAGFLKAGYNYNITAFAPGFDIVQASTLIPRPSTISDLLVEDLREQQSPAHEFKRILLYKLSFGIDHFETNRYYHLVFYNEYTGDPKLYILNPEPSDDHPYIPHYEYGLLLDRLDLNDNERLTFDFKDWVVNDDKLERIYVELRTISEEYYRYHSTLTRQLIVRQDPFAEPVTIYNNIEGGFGNFSGFSPDVTSSDLPQ